MAPALGDRYFMILLDEAQRTIQVAVIHPSREPEHRRDGLARIAGPDGGLSTAEMELAMVDPSTRVAVVTSQAETLTRAVALGDEEAARSVVRGSNGCASRGTIRQLATDQYDKKIPHHGSHDSASIYTLNNTT